MGWYIWVNTGSDDGVLPYSAKLLSEPVSTRHQRSPVAVFHIKAISQDTCAHEEHTKMFIIKMGFKKKHTHLIS